MKKIFIIIITLIFTLNAALVARYITDREAREEDKACFKRLAVCKEDCREKYINDYNKRDDCRKECKFLFYACINRIESPEDL